MSDAWTIDMDPNRRYTFNIEADNISIILDALDAHFNMGIHGYECISAPKRNELYITSPCGVKYRWNFVTRNWEEVK